MVIYGSTIFKMCDNERCIVYLENHLYLLLHSSKVKGILSRFWESNTLHLYKCIVCLIIDSNRYSTRHTHIQRKRESEREMEWRKCYLDVILVPLGFLLTIAYHLWLCHKVRTQPLTTTIGRNAHGRRFWVGAMMKVSLTISLSCFYTSFQQSCHVQYVQ